MAEPTTKWLQNPSYDQGDVTFNDTGTRFNASLNFNGVPVANQIPINASQNTGWSGATEPTAGWSGSSSEPTTAWSS